MLHKDCAQSGGFCLDLSKVQALLGHRIVVCANDGAGSIPKGNKFHRFEEPFPGCHTVRNYDTGCVSLAHLCKNLWLGHGHSLSISGCGDFQSVMFAVPQILPCAVLFFCCRVVFPSPQYILKRQTHVRTPADLMYRDYCPADAEIQVPARVGAGAMPRYKIDRVHPAQLAH